MSTLKTELRATEVGDVVDEVSGVIEESYTDYLNALKQKLRPLVRFPPSYACLPSLSTPTFCYSQPCS